MQNINLSDLSASLFINRGWQTPTKNSHNHMYLINTEKFMTFYILKLNALFHMKISMEENLISNEH